MEFHQNLQCGKHLAETRLVLSRRRPTDQFDTPFGQQVLALGPKN